MGRPEYWTEGRIRELAHNYEFISDLAKDYEGAYAALKTRYKHLKDELFPAFKKLEWTNDKLEIEAKKYERRVDFRNNSLGAYSRAQQLGILDDVCSHMINGRVRGSFDLGQHAGLSGIYFLYSNNNVVYIGKSESCMVSRIRSHPTDKEFSEVRLHSIENVADILIIEAYLIATMKPIYNIEYNTECAPSFILPDVDKILGKPVVINSFKGRA